MILAIETSCDETAVALVSSTHQVLAEKVFSQIDMFAAFGGVVPEISSRAHVAKLLPLIKQLLDDHQSSFDNISAIAVTQGPGLAGSLLMGQSTAKALAYAFQKPLIPVDHIAGHVFSGFMLKDKLEFPFLAFVISGGHTHLFRCEKDYTLKLLAATLDDAVGEAFDKVAKLIGLGYPGGAKIEALAKTYMASDSKEQVMFKTPMQDKKMQGYSFSGLKTAVYQWLHKHPQELPEKIAANFQETATDLLIKNTMGHIENNLDAKAFVLAGGVACNQYIREAFADVLTDKMPLLLAEKKWCGDNASMIGFLASHLYCQSNEFVANDFKAYSSLGESPVVS